MRAIYILNIIFLSALFGIFYGCSNNDPEPDCFLEHDLDIIATITNAEGTIRGPESGFCEGDYVIEPDDKVESGPLGLFFPCNLGDEFEVDGIRVEFSGYFYEAPANVDICADWFEIAEIKLTDQ